ncbi:hypothetical protein [[Phormidium] sp. ETS-05]|uniref:hypothetical protein n=1 Tax=[Phormidium] sp. ETS-05 TaxID=222819 RepID=UPI0018EEEBBD|nr:hypothetical protein [[Phormidium] sp. ETS-05]
MVTTHPSIQTFTITVDAVNDPPSFSNLGNQTLSTWTNSPQTVNNWANTFIFGPVDEKHPNRCRLSGKRHIWQHLIYYSPDIADDGTLTYTPQGKQVQPPFPFNSKIMAVQPTAVMIHLRSYLYHHHSPPTVNLGVIPNSGSEAGTSTITITATAAYLSLATKP